MYMLRSLCLLVVVRRLTLLQAVNHSQHSYDGMFVIVLLGDGEGYTIGRRAETVKELANAWDGGCLRRRRMAAVREVR